MARDRQCVLQLVSVAVCLWIFIQSVMADYVIEIRVMSYSNPTNECAECPSRSGVRCCDSSHQTVCAGRFQPCDNQFYYCLRPPNTLPVLNAGGCIGYNQTVTSSVNWNDFSINFTELTVLGLPNPMNLTGLDTFWQGVLLFIEVIDIDPYRKVDDFVDSFSINMLENTTKGSYLTLRNKSSTYNLATISLTARFLCAENYIGELCETFDYCSARQINCKGHGVCINGVNGYTCDCEPGFTGTHCETDVNECMLTEPECSGHGRCTVGVNSFTCVCEQGFTGLLCETNIDECAGVNCSGRGQCVDGVNNFTCDCEPGYTGASCTMDVLGEVGGSSGGIMGGIIGGVVGGLVAVILTVLLLILLVVLVTTAVRKRQVQVTQDQTPKLTSYLPGDNPVYGIPDTEIIKQFAGAETTDTDSNEIEFDNPIYGDNENESQEPDTPNTTGQLPAYETISPLYSTVRCDDDTVRTHPQTGDHDEQQVYHYVV